MSDTIRRTFSARILYMVKSLEGLKGRSHTETLLHFFEVGLCEVQVGVLTTVDGGQHVPSLEKQQD